MHPQEVIPVRPTVLLNVMTCVAVQPFTPCLHCWQRCYVSDLLLSTAPSIKIARNFCFVPIVRLSILLIFLRPNYFYV